MSEVAVHHTFDDPELPGATILEWREGDMEMTVEITHDTVYRCWDCTATGMVRDVRLPLTLENLRKLLAS